MLNTMPWHQNVCHNVKKYVKMSKSTPCSQNVWKVRHDAQKHVIMSTREMTARKISQFSILRGGRCQALACGGRGICHLWLPCWHLFYEYLGSIWHFCNDLFAGLSTIKWFFLHFQLPWYWPLIIAYDTSRQWRNHMHIKFCGNWPTLNGLQTHRHTNTWTPATQ